MEGKTKLIDCGMSYCKSMETCDNCPLLKGVCIDTTGKLIGVDDSTTLYDLYDMLYHFSVYADDTNFMK